MFYVDMLCLYIFSCTTCVPKKRALGPPGTDKLPSGCRELNPDPL